MPIAFCFMDDDGFLWEYLGQNTYASEAALSIGDPNSPTINVAINSTSVVIGTPTSNVFINSTALVANQVICISGNITSLLCNTLNGNTANVANISCNSLLGNTVNVSNIFCNVLSGNIANLVNLSCNTLIFSTLPTNCASDAAAASAGIPVGGIYMNAGVLMVRQS